jgi:hypothetical protein
MINDLGVAQLLVLPRQFIMKPPQLFFNYRLGFIQMDDLPVDSFKFFLQLPDRLLLSDFVRFHTKQAGSQFRLTDIHLLHHRVKTPDLGFDSRAAVQGIDNCIFSRLYVIV